MVLTFAVILKLSWIAHNQEKAYSTFGIWIQIINHIVEKTHVGSNMTNEDASYVNHYRAFLNY